MKSMEIRRIWYIHNETGKELGSSRQDETHSVNKIDDLCRVGSTFQLPPLIMALRLVYTVLPIEESRDPRRLFLQIIVLGGSPPDT